MRRKIEIVVCDVCGVEMDADRQKMKLAVDDERVTVDACDKCRGIIHKTFDSWTAGLDGTTTTSAPRVGAKRAAETARVDDEWDYLETQGFVRHRGRKTAAEQAALDARVTEPVDASLN